MTHRRDENAQMVGASVVEVQLGGDSQCVGGTVVRHVGEHVFEEGHREGDDQQEEVTRQGEVDVPERWSSLEGEKLTHQQMERYR